MKREVFYARTGKDELEKLRRITMAKDPSMSGPVSRLEGGEYESSEEIRAASADPSMSTRSEIINNFGEDLGRKLLDAGYSSMSSMDGVSDEDFLAITGVGPAALEKIHEVLTLGLLEADDGMEEETPDEPAVEETVEPEVETTKEVDEPEEEQEVSEGVLPEEPAPPPEESPVAEVAAVPVAEPEEPLWGAEGGMSVRVRRNKERAAKEEAERKRLAAIEDQHAKPEPSIMDLGSVDVDFVPEPDPESTADEVAE